MPKAIPSPLALLSTMALSSALFSGAPLEAQDFDAVEIRLEKITESIYMLMGEGGNMALCVGEDGAFLVDDQYAPLTEKIEAAIATVTDQPVRFVINTHFHFDHTGGNENFGDGGSVVVSHENSRLRMLEDQTIYLFGREQPMSPEGALPIVTFEDAVRFYLNGETIDVFHPGPGHTDGDSFVYFRDSDVMHTGDVFVSMGLPYIDLFNGGSIDGTIEALGDLLEVTTPDTRIIPGHGPLTDRSQIFEIHSALVTIRNRVQDLMEQGRTLDEIVEMNPAEGFTDKGMPHDAFVRTVYESLAGR